MCASSYKSVSTLAVLQSYGVAHARLGHTNVCLQHLHSLLTKPADAQSHIFTHNPKVHVHLLHSYLLLGQHRP